MRCPPFLLVLALLGAGGCAAPSPVTEPPDATTTTAAPTPMTTATATTTATARAPAPAPTATPTPCPDTAAITSATWLLTAAEGGRSLAVAPADGLRDCAGPLLRWDGIPPGWAEVLDLAGPEADTTAMRQQYACHLRFARAKETWNLEPWRPEVAEDELVLARCNP